MTATPDTEKLTGTGEHSDNSHPYHVVLLNDDLHTYDYIVEMLGKLFLQSHAQAMRHAVEIDTTGRSIVLTCELPQAEFARDQIHAFGPDHRVKGCKGSMTAIVEPAHGQQA